MRRGNSRFLFRGVCVSLLFNQLYRATLRGSTSLALNKIELRVTKVTLNSPSRVFALLSILLVSLYRMRGVGCRILHCLR